MSHPADTPTNSNQPDQWSDGEPDTRVDGADPMSDHYRPETEAVGAPTAGVDPRPTYQTAGPVGGPPLVADRAAVVARQKARFGGMKIGSAFFGWLTATGMSVLLISLLAAGGVAFGVATNASVSVDQAVEESAQATGTAQTVGLIGGITLLVVLLVAYYCGGYVAGRMARFSGAKQGLAVWLWGIVMALIIAAIAAVAGAQYDVFAQLNLPRLPVNEGQVTAVGAIVIVAAVLTALVGAVLGGLAGMRFHRKVDQAALEPLNS